MPASFSAAAKPFFPELDSRLYFLSQKFIFLQNLLFEAMKSTNPALISQIKIAFNLLFEEQQFYFSTDMDNTSVSEPASFHPFSIPLQSSQPEMSNLFVPPKTLKKELTSRQKKKQERGAK